MMALLKASALIVLWLLGIDGASFIIFRDSTDMSSPVLKVTHQTGRDDSGFRFNENQTVFGQENEPVQVLVSIRSKGQTLLCRSRATQDSPLEYAVYQWTTANGQKVTASDSVNIMPSGKLVFQNFLAKHSGEYYCTTTYRLGGFQFKRKYTFLVLGYHKPDMSLNIGVEFLSQDCIENANRLLVQSVISQLQARLTDKGCEVKEKATHCQWKSEDITSQADQVIVRLELDVFPFGVLWEQQCPPGIVSQDCDKETEEQTKKAYSRIQEYFSAFTEFETAVPGLRKMLYNNNSLKAFRISHCKPGFGKDSSLQACPGCCVVCKPGTFSSETSSFCQKCPRGSYSVDFGKSSCISCSSEDYTNSAGSSSQQQCAPKKIMPFIKAGIVLLSVVIILFLIIIGICLKVAFFPKSYQPITNEDLSLSGEEAV